MRSKLGELHGKDTPKVPENLELISSVIMLVAAVLILVFFMDFNSGSGTLLNIKINIKPGHSFWAWSIFSVSSMLYYFIRSKGATTIGGYHNPVFSRFVKFLRLLPLLGVVLSFLGMGYIVENHTWAGAVKNASQFIDDLLILFLVASVAGSLKEIIRFFRG